MKKSLLVVAIISFAMASFHASAGNNSNNSDTYNNYGDTNTTNRGGEGGDANSLGIGIGVGGSANATGGDATAIGLGGQGGDAAAIGIGGQGGKSDADASAKAGANAGSSSGGNSLTVNEGDYEARAIPVGSSIAAGANGTSKCLKHSSVSGNLFFVSGAKASHEPDYMCWAQELGAPEVAVQMACNDSGSFRKAYNQIARRNGTEECLSE
ncbi:MAG TPA: hypothetical protein VD999_07815 [Vitreimonas sp.]|nr:hypothetical protein [Vitreimonas sp.]